MHNVVERLPGSDAGRVISLLSLRAPIAQSSLYARAGAGSHVVTRIQSALPSIVVIDTVLFSFSGVGQAALA
jgi:hypothetical protein